MDEQVGVRYVTCFCGHTQVASRRDPVFDRYAVCSRSCWDNMVRHGKNEPGSLLGDRR